MAALPSDVTNNIAVNHVTLQVNQLMLIHAGNVPCHAFYSLVQAQLLVDLGCGK